MNDSPFSSRNIFLLSSALMLILASIACVGNFRICCASASFYRTCCCRDTSQPTQIDSAPAIPETRRLTLEFPSKMRAGVEGDIIRLTLEVDDLGNITPTAQIEGNVVVGETIEIPDLYETHNVTAEARLDLAGMQVQPADAIYEPLKRGQSATFLLEYPPAGNGDVSRDGLAAFELCR